MCFYVLFVKVRAGVTLVPINQCNLVLVKDVLCGRVVLNKCNVVVVKDADAPPQQKQARRHDDPRVIAAASNPGSHGSRSPRAVRGGGGGRGASAVRAL